MSAQQLLYRSSTDSSPTLHGSDDGFSTLSLHLDHRMQNSKWPTIFQSPSAIPHYLLHCIFASGRHAFRWTAFLLPSFIRDWNRVEHQELPLPRGKQALLALNGLRGVACLIVFCYHLMFVWTHSTDVSWGTIIDITELEEKEAAKYRGNDQKSLLQLPFIRLLYAGHAMVIVFFVISGYVLSHKSMKLIQVGKFEELQRVLSSSVFRRGIRLFGPTLVGTFITMLLTGAGYFEAGKAVRIDTVTYMGNNEEHPILSATLCEQVWDWLRSMGFLVGNVWDWGLYFNNYDPHLWTIPLEFRSSMVLFICLLSFSRLRPFPRLVLMTGLATSCLVFWARWEVFLFLSGMIFAELDILSGMFNETSLLDEKEDGESHRSNSWPWACIMLCGLFLSSCPSAQPENAPGYRYLATYISEQYDWQPGRPFQAIGGCLVVWSFMHLPMLQRIFNTAVAQYLGQISFSFYIVHGPILHGFGYNLVLKCWSMTGRETTAGFASGLGLAVLVILPLAIWAGDIFWRFVDTPCVEFAKWTETNLSAEPQD